MKENKRTSLITVLIVTIGVLFVFLAGIQMVLVTGYTKHSTSRSYGENCGQIAQAYALMLTNRMNMYLREIRMYVDADIVQTQDVDQIVEWMKSRNQKKSYNIDAMYFCTPDGTAYRDDGTVSDVRNEEFFKAIINDGNFQYVSNPKMDEVMKKPIIFVSQVVIVNGKKLGVFAGVYPLSTIQKMVSDIQLGESGNAWLLAGDGTVISYPVNGYSMKKNFVKGLSSEHADLRQIAEDMCARKTGSGWIAALDAKEKEFVTYTPVHNTPWSLGFNIGAGQIYSTGHSIRDILFISSIVMAVALLLVTAMLLYAMLSPLQKVELAINDIATGNADLTKRISIRSNNEIGAIVLGFNNFTQKLQSIISELKKSQETLTSVGAQLSGSTSDSANAIASIKDSIRETDFGIKEQTGSIEETSTSINEISSNIETLEKMISAQVTGIEKASGAVEQMIGKIDLVGESFERMNLAFNTLSESAEDGHTKQADVDEKIKQIESESKMLQEANSAIASIASQTNLLAMNAAIEAAHAGDAGRGFSVVADEIRKLSETSTSQSKTIGNSLKKIRGSIESVVDASRKSSDAYNDITGNIKTTDELVRSIHDVLQDQREGSTLIIQALHEMNGSSTEVRAASSEMTEGSRHILSQVGILKDGTVRMHSCMKQMDDSAREIDSSGLELMDISSKVGETISQIGTQIDKFKV